MTIKKWRATGLRRGCKEKQQRAGILCNIFKLGTKLFKQRYLKKKKTFEIGLRATNSALGKNIVKEGIQQTPAIYKAGVKRIKNNKIKSVLKSDLANYTVFFTGTGTTLQLAKCLKEYQIFR